MFQVRTVIALLLSAVAFPAAGSAQGSCVECSGPDRVYRCSIKDSEKAQGVRGLGRAIDYVCMTEIARAGGHQNCRVGTSFSGPCIGQAFEIDMAKVALPPPPPVDATAAGAGGSPAEVPTKAAAAPAKSGPPQTLEELARITVSKSKEQMSAADETVRQAGGAVKGGLQKTWDCVASLFSRC